MNRFWVKVDKTEGCWWWTAANDKDGYGLFSFGRGQIVASRFAYLACVGPIPDGMKVCHQCDNPRCCRPDHLFIGTTADNHADRNRKGRQAKGETQGSAKLNADKVRGIRVGREAGKTISELASEFGVSPTGVKKVLTGKTWGHVV